MRARDIFRRSRLLRETGKTRFEICNENEDFNDIGGIDYDEVFPTFDEAKQTDNVIRKKMPKITKQSQSMMRNNRVVIPNSPKAKIVESVRPPPSGGKSAAQSASPPHHGGKSATQIVDIELLEVVVPATSKTGNTPKAKEVDPATSKSGKTQAQ